MTAVQVSIQPGEHRSFDPDQIAAVCAVIEATALDVRRVLPGLRSDLAVTVHPVVDSANGVPELAVGGYAGWADRARIDIDLASGVAWSDVMTRYLPAAVHHELHHCARIGALGMPLTAADNAVFEGLATVFEEQALGYRPPWGDYCAVPIEEWVEEFLANGSTSDHRAWFFAHPDGRRWIGYRVGTYLADRAITASHMSAADLATVPTAVILGYAGVHRPAARPASCGRDEGIQPSR